MQSLKNKVTNARNNLQREIDEYKEIENYLQNKADLEYEKNLAKNEYLRNKESKERDRIKEKNS